MSLGEIDRVIELNDKSTVQERQYPFYGWKQVRKQLALDHDQIGPLDHHDIDDSSDKACRDIHKLRQQAKEGDSHFDNLEVGRTKEWMDDTCDTGSF